MRLSKARWFTKLDVRNAYNCHACRWGLALGQSQRQEGGQLHTKPPAGASSVGFGVVRGSPARWRYPQREFPVIPEQGGSR